MDTQGAVANRVERKRSRDPRLQQTERIDSRWFPSLLAFLFHLSPILLGDLSFLSFLSIFFLFLALVVVLVLVAPLRFLCGVVKGQSMDKTQSIFGWRQLPDLCFIAASYRLKSSPIPATISSVALLKNLQRCCRLLLAFTSPPPSSPWFMSFDSAD